MNECYGMCLPNQRCTHKSHHPRMPNQTYLRDTSSVMVEKLRLMFDFTNKIKNLERVLTAIILLHISYRFYLQNPWIRQLLARELLDPFYFTDFPYEPLDHHDHGDHMIMP